MSAKPVSTEGSAGRAVVTHLCVAEFHTSNIGLSQRIVQCRDSENTAFVVVLLRKGFRGVPPGKGFDFNTPGWAQRWTHAARKNPHELPHATRIRFDHLALCRVGGGYM